MAPGSSRPRRPPAASSRPTCRGTRSSRRPAAEDRVPDPEARRRRAAMLQRRPARATGCSTRSPGPGRWGRRLRSSAGATSLIDESDEAVAVIEQRLGGLAPAPARRRASATPAADADPRKNHRVRRRRHLRASRARPRDRPTPARAVEDAVSLVGDERSPSSTRSPASTAGSRRPLRDRKRDGIDLDRSAPALPGPRTSFVSSARAAIRRPPNACDLLAQVRAARPLVRSRIVRVLVGPVDHHVELADVRRASERDSQLAAAPPQSLPTSDAGERPRAPEGEPLAQRLEHPRGRRPASQPTASPAPRTVEQQQRRLDLQSLGSGRAIRVGGRSSVRSGARQRTARRCRQPAPLDEPLPSSSRTPGAPPPSPKA